MQSIRETRGAWGRLALGVALAAGLGAGPAWAQEMEEEEEEALQMSTGAPPGGEESEVEQLPPAEVAPRLVPQGCSGAQTQAIENARRAAAIRSQTATFQLRGIVPHNPDVARMRARNLAFEVFGEQLNMEQAAEIVEQMRDTLTSPNLRVVCAPANDTNCGSRSGYVVNHQQPIHLCPRFFRGSTEDRIRTMVHESAHVAGISQKGGETYCPVFDCDTACGGFYAADAWSHYVHCLSGQPPDAPDTF